MTTTNSATPEPTLERADRGSRSPARGAARGRSRGLAWLALALSALLELVWATALAASEGFSLALPAVVFVLTAIASAVGLGYAVRTVSVVPAFVVWGAISAVVTVAWMLLTGVAVSSVVTVAVLVVALGVVGGLQLLLPRRTQSAS